MFMKTLRILVTIAALALLTRSASAQTKIGLVDLQKVFDGYYKTKAASALLKDEEASLKKQSDALMEQYQKATDDYKKALDDANNQAVSAEEREKRKKSAEANLIEIKRMEDQMTQFKRSAESTLGERLHKMRENILEEIRVVVNAKGKAGGYSMILDTASESRNFTPILLYNNGENDITAGVLAQLNASEPPSSSRPNEKKEDKK